MRAFSADAASETEMIAAGHSLAGELATGDVIALNGPLGAGKTHFAKGVVAGLGSEDDVTSPTFALVNEYRSGRMPVFHFDFYRLEAADELLRIGWDEYLDEDGIILVEWADKFPELLPGETRIFDLTIEDSGNHSVIER